VIDTNYEASSRDILSSNVVYSNMFLWNVDVLPQNYTGS